MAQTTKPEVPQLARVIAGATPPLAAEDQHLALALYRHLARGEPVATVALAAAMERDAAEVEATLARWPGVYRGDDDRILAFWGLALPEMAHGFRLDERQLYTWCAWDALFIPGLIGETAEVESRSPVSGERVRLRVAPERVLEVEPRGMVVSMLAPRKRFDYQVVTSFCHFVHFLSSSADAEGWLVEHPETFLLTVDEAFELGRLTNRAKFGEALDNAT